MYPNPAGDFVQFTILDEIEYTLLITDLFGREIIVSTLSKSKNKLDTHTLPNGTYLVILSGDGNLQSKKLIIQR